MISPHRRKETAVSSLHELLKPVTDQLEQLGEELAIKADHLFARLNGKLDEDEKRLLAWVTTHLAAADAIVDEPTAETPDELAEQREQDVSAQGGEIPVDGAQGEGTVGDGGDATAADSGQPIL
jgi:hypothetical protein